MDEMDEIELQTLEAEVALVVLRDGAEYATETAYRELVAAGINDLADAVLALDKCVILPTPPSQPFRFGPWQWPGIADNKNMSFRALAHVANSKEYEYEYYNVFICGDYGKNRWNITECSNDIVNWAGDDPQRILQVLRALRDATAWCYAMGRR